MRWSKYRLGILMHYCIAVVSLVAVSYRCLQLLMRLRGHIPIVPPYRPAFTVPDIIAHVEAVVRLKEYPEFNNVRSSIVRCMKILPGDFRPARIGRVTNGEQELYDHLIGCSASTPDEVVNYLVTLAPVVDRFFDGNMIMVDNATTRQRRLTLVYMVVWISNLLGDFKLLIPNKEES